MARRSDQIQQHDKSPADQTTDFRPPGLGNNQMKLPTFARKTAQATRPQMFDERPLAPDASSQGSLTGIIGREDIRFAARLPVPAQHIIRAIADESDELNVLSHSLHGRREQIREAKGRAEGRIYELQNPLNTYHEQSGPEIENQRKIVAECQADLVRLGERMADVNAKARVFSRLLESARILVRNAGDKPITLHAGQQPLQLRKNETALEAIEARRRRFRELEADFNRAEVAPKLSADIKAQEIARIEFLAKQGAPNCFTAIEQGLSIEWPTTTMLLPDGMLATVVDSIAVLAWLHRDAMIAAVTREIDLMADDANALSDSDREKLLMQITRDKLATEREEVAFVRMANAHGGNISFRGDTDPRALLNLSDDMPAPRRD